jgi:hypothetical protein
MIPPRLRRIALLAAAAFVLAGCQTLEVKRPTVEQTAQIRVGPEDRPQRTITGFTPALRCMDTLMLEYGIRDVTMLTEEIADETKKLKAGTRDMLISAVSDMSRRSRAIRLIAFGQDTANAITFMATAQSGSAYQAVPLYDIKGSVSQFDENLIKNQKDLGVGISPFINLGIARDAASSMIALDLSVLSTADMGVLPGVTSRNSVIVLKQGRGIDGDAAYHKFGINYSMNLARSEGQSQALRGLVELATVELIGKLTKTPYWTCLGVTDPIANEETRLEMFDWYHAMAATRVELIAWFQHQLRVRGYYDGPVDGVFNPAIDEAIANHRRALGLEPKALLDEAYFVAFLRADHRAIARPAQPVRYLPPDAAGPGAAAAAPLRLTIDTPDRQSRFAPGEPIRLAITPSRDAHVYCYLQDETGRVVRFFPNRFERDSRVAAASGLQLPGRQRFRLYMNTRGVTERVSCFATPRDVLDALPAALVGTDFEPLPDVGLDALRAAFEKASGGTLAQETLHVQAR